ncbi:NAD(P)/FAD-dependent oxidoreductase [Halomarina ordinaria]|uniref:NAD(P)/FAD-dependent oxidoreductase n=1 Tax=Halomarina ordinaria TaxID=3033939 RepID=A0ABD5U4W2_9EURY|nr:NAD(P)/FAD-dependent oxidoreductase [Halomarina sp. PSRA2]
MTENVVVLGSGYAGAGAIKSIEDKLGDQVDLTWISDVDHHLVLHEAHRVVRNPAVKEKIAIPVEEIKAPSTRFIQAEVTGIDTEDREVELDDGTTVTYDYCVVAIGSQTAYFGIEGLEEHAYTLKSLDHALDIHDAVKEAARDASRSDRAQIVVGGAGLSGIQTAGEIAEFRDKHRAPIDIHLVEGLESVFPPGEPELQEKLDEMLRERDINIMTGEFIGKVDDETVYIGDDTELDYDVLIWTGGITGQKVAESLDLDQDERNHRLTATSTFQTSDDRVFAVGDSALVDQLSGEPAPPTAQAAWQAAEVIGENIKRAMNGQPLKQWEHVDKGTLISVGDEAVAYDVRPVNGFSLPVKLFDGLPAETLKKGVASRWVKRVAGPSRAAKAWPDM